MCKHASVSDTTDDLITTAEAAAIKGTTVATINRWAASGRLPVAIKIPGRTGANLFRRTDIENDATGDTAA